MLCVRCAERVKNGSTLRRNSAHTSSVVWSANKIGARVGIMNYQASMTGCTYHAQQDGALRATREGEAHM